MRLPTDRAFHPVTFATRDGAFFSPAHPDFKAGDMRDTFRKLADSPNAILPGDWPTDYSCNSFRWANAKDNIRRDNEYKARLGR